MEEIDNDEIFAAEEEMQALGGFIKDLESDLELQGEAILCLKNDWSSAQTAAGLIKQKSEQAM